MNLRLALKRTFQGMALLLVFPWALVCGFGRLLPVYTIGAHMLALGPGVIGNFLRAAFYRLTLRECSIDTNIAFGSFVVHPDTAIASHVSVGAYCVIGKVSIGRGTQIASHVEITGGRHQHERDGRGHFGEAIHETSAIGEYCWIGASAIIMAAVGSRSTIGAGAVEVKDIPAGVVAAGNPARILRAAEGI